MAEWIPPKTNWQAGDIPGAGDFNRSEGNAEYLKEQVDGVKTRLGRIRIARGVVRLSDGVGEGREDIAHNLGSTNVIVILHYAEANTSVTKLRYQILNANTIRVHGMPGSLVDYQIVRLS